MSNLGQAALTIVGTAVGYYFGYPQLGLVLGSLAGQALFPTQLPGLTGPKISDLNTTTAELGGPVLWVFGTIAVPGTVMYLGPLVTITTTSHQGKGGPSQSTTSFSYTQSIAIGLCRGIIGLRRAWENGELVYDTRPQQPGETDDAFGKRVKAAGKYAESFVFYPGDEEQLADPTIELDKGVGNTPAFRGLAYIVFPDRALREDQALRHPSFKFEVYSSGVGGCVEDDELFPAVLHPWINTSKGDPANDNNNNQYSIVQHPNVGVGPVVGPYDSAAAALAAVAASIPPDKTYDGPFLLGMSPSQNLDQQVWANLGGPGVSDVGWRDTLSCLIHYNANRENPVFYTDLSGDFNGICADAFAAGEETGIHHDGNVTVWFPQFNEMTVPADGYWDNGSSSCLNIDTTSGVANALDWVIKVSRIPGAPADPCRGQTEGPPGYYTAPDGTVIPCQAYEEVDDPTHAYMILADWRTGEITLGGLPIQVYQSNRPAQGPIILATSPDNTQAFWTAAYNKAVAAGTLPAGWTWNGEYPVVMRSRIFKRAGQKCSTAVDEVSLADIIEQICAATGLTSIANVDAEDLRDVMIDGYALGSIMTGRDALTPLRSVGFWDCVESGRTLKFVSRGKDSVATLSQSDLGAADADGGETAAPAVSTDRMQDVDLPRRIRVHYIASSRDYGDGQQQSLARITTKAVNDTDVQLAVAMNDDLAAQIAEVLWADAWAGRQSYTINLDRSYLPLEGADCVHLPTEGDLVRARILSISDASALLRKVSLIQDDNQAYVSQAVGQPPQIPLSTIKLASSTNLLLLDLPALADADDDAGIYGLTDEAVDGTAWAGAIVYRSIDGTNGWTQLAVFTVQASRGVLLAPAPAGPSDTWDRGSQLLVELDYGPDLENRTEADLLNGANAAAIGVNGRWEIIQFATATPTGEVGSNQYLLTNLLRGRRGTESQIGTAQAGDYFVVISTGAVNRLPIDIANIGVSYIYRAVTIGKPFAEGIEQTFAGHGRALVPFSPVQPSLDRADSGELTLSWIRRGRLGQELRSGVDIALSEASEAYDVEILAAGSPDQILRTYRASSQSVVYSEADQITDHEIVLQIGQHLFAKVYQVSETVGRGPPLLVDLRVGGIQPAPPTVTHSAVFDFSGTFNSSDNVVVSLIFVPSDGTATVHATMTLEGSTKSQLADYATDLADQVDDNFDVRVTTFISGATLTIGSTFGSFIPSYITNSPVSTVARIQEAGPVSAGLRTIWFVDLYTGLDFLAPDSAAAYTQAGQGLLTITVHSYDADEENRLSRLQIPPIPAGLQAGEFYFHGVSSTVVYAVDSGATSRLSALSHLPNAIQNDPIIGTYVLGATLGQLTGTPDGTMTRAAVSFSMKPGYYVELNEGQGQPSGFVAKIRLLQNGGAVYSSPGRKQIVTVQFADAFDYQTGIFYSQVELGQIYEITIDGVTYSHTADATDLTDPNTQSGGYYHDFIYDDLTSQIEGAGYTVVQDKLYRFQGTTDTFVVQLAIYGTGNTAYTVSADVPFDTIVTLTMT